MQTSPKKFTKILRLLSFNCCSVKWTWVIMMSNYPKCQVGTKNMIQHLHAHNKKKLKTVILISLVQFYWRFIWLFNVLFWNKISRWHIVITFFSRKQFESRKMRSVWKYYFYGGNILFDFKISYLPNFTIFFWRSFFVLL